MAQGAKSLQTSVACPLLCAMAVCLCRVQPTHGFAPVLVPILVSLSQESWLRALPTLRPQHRVHELVGWMPQDALCPPAAVAGTHDKEVLRDLINEALTEKV